MGCISACHLSVRILEPSLPAIQLQMGHIQRSPVSISAIRGYIQERLDRRTIPARIVVGAHQELPLTSSDIFLHNSLVNASAPRAACARAVLPARASSLAPATPADTSSKLAQSSSSRDIRPSTRPGAIHTKQWRGPATRCDKHAITYRDAVLIRTTLAWTQQLSDMT